MEEIKYCGKFVSVKEKIINGQTWEMVTIPDSLVVIPITSKDEIIFIVESRPHETPNKRLKLVTGHIDSYESPIDCANRELQEEAGFKAKDLEEIMVHRSTGTINSNFHYIVAKDLVPSKMLNPDGEETILQVKKISIKNVKHMLFTDQLPWTLSTLGLFKLFETYRASNE